MNNLLVLHIVNLKRIDFDLLLCVEWRRRKLWNFLANLRIYSIHSAIVYIILLYKHVSFPFLSFYLHSIPCFIWCIKDLGWSVILSDWVLLNLFSFSFSFMSCLLTSYLRRTHILSGFHYNMMFCYALRGREYGIGCHLEINWKFHNNCLDEEEFFRTSCLV